MGFSGRFRTSLNGVIDASKDITAGLIPVDNVVCASVINRDDCVICGVAWVNEVFKQLDQAFGHQSKITWFVNDGETAKS